MLCLSVCSQALDWIQETGDVYLATHTSPGDSSEETQQLLNNYHHFKLSAKVISVLHRKEKYKKTSLSQNIQNM